MMCYSTILATSLGYIHNLRDCACAGTICSFSSPEMCQVLLKDVHKHLLFAGLQCSWSVPPYLRHCSPSSVVMTEYKATGYCQACTTQASMTMHCNLATLYLDDVLHDLHMYTVNKRKYSATGVVQNRRTYFKHCIYSSSKSSKCPPHMLNSFFRI